MSQELSDAELRDERLVQVALEGEAPDLLALPLVDLHVVLAARLEMAGLMLKLALKMEQGGVQS